MSEESRASIIYYPYICVYIHTCMYSIWVGRSLWMFVYFWTPNSETHSLASCCWVSTSVLHICDCFSFLSTLISSHWRIRTLSPKATVHLGTLWLSFEIHKEIQGTSEYPSRKIKLGHVKPHHMLIGPQGQLSFCNLLSLYTWKLEKQLKIIPFQNQTRCFVCQFLSKAITFMYKNPLECRWKGVCSSRASSCGLLQYLLMSQNTQLSSDNSNVSNQPSTPRRPWSIRHKPLVRSYGSGASRRPKSKPYRSVGHARRVPSKTVVGIPVGWKRLANCTTSLPSMAWWYGGSYIAR